ncbi:MAG: MFS transporter [bacterium]|nr:MFS transporter [bacterium]
MNLQLLKKKNFFLLMQGSLTSQIGSMLQTFALSLYVLEKFDSPELFASILIISIIPRIILGPFAGVFVDWFDRKKIIVRFDLMSCIIVGIAAFLFFYLGELPLWSIYTVTILLSLISTLFQPAIATVLPNIIDKKDLVEANAINSMLITISSIISPLLGGALLGLASMGVILIINSASFFISAITEMFITIPPAHKTPEKFDLGSFKKDFMEGIVFIKKTRFILTIGIIAMVLNLGISPVFSIAIPYILKKVMIIKDIEFGIFNGVLAMASLVGGLLAGKVSKKFSTSKILIFDFSLQPIITVLIAFITSTAVLGLFNCYYIPFLLLCLVLCFLITAMTIGNISINTTFQKLIPNELMGRVGTVIGTFCMCAVPIGQAIFGYMLERFEPWVPLCLSAFILLLVVFKSYPVLKMYKDDTQEDTTNSKEALEVITES